MENQQDPELLISATVFLMTQYALQDARREVALGVVNHLERLVMAREVLPPILANALPRLRQQWLALAARPINWVPEHGQPPLAGRAGASRRGNDGNVVPFCRKERAHG